MYFQIGHYYKQSGGGMIHIVGAARTTLYGWTLLAEEHGSSNFRPVGSDEGSTVNWTEATEAEWMTGFSK